MPNAQHMIERGLLVEQLRPRNGTVYTCQETIDELLSAWTPDEPLGYTTTMHLPITNSLSRATPPSPQNASPTLLGERLQALAEEVLARYQSSDGVNLLLANDTLLKWQGLVADERQPGYTLERALASATALRQALMALDAFFGRLLRQLDLAASTLALVSPCFAAPVYSMLDMSAIETQHATILAGATIAEVDANARWPREGLWADVQQALACDSQDRLRLVAPPGLVFGHAGADLPHVAPRPQGFLLGVGHAVAPATRLRVFSPQEASMLFAHASHSSEL